MHYEIGDEVSQWPKTKYGVIINYGWDHHCDEGTYTIKWEDGEITTEYEETINYYCDPEAEDEDIESKRSTYIEAFSEMYDLIEEGKEFADAKEDVTLKYDLSRDDQNQLVADYDECERINAFQRK